MTGKQREPDVRSRSDDPGGAHTVEIAAGESPSEAVVRAIAEATDRGVLDLPPLYESVDPDALDTLFDRRPDGTPRQPGRVVFPLEDWLVAVDCTAVSITPSPTTPGASP